METLTRDEIAAKRRQLLRLLAVRAVVVPSTDRKRRAELRAQIDDLANEIRILERK